MTKKVINTKPENSLVKKKRRVRRAGKLSRLMGVLGNQLLLLTGFILCMVGLIVSLIWLAYENDMRTRYVAETSRLVMLSQRIPRDAYLSVTKGGDAFKSLSGSRDLFRQSLDALSEGSSAGHIAPTPDKLRDKLYPVQKDWASLNENVGVILSHAGQLNASNKNIGTINQLSPDLVLRVDELVALLLSKQSPAALVNVAARLGMLSQRVIKDVNLFSLGGVQAAEAATEFGLDITTFEDSIQQLRAATGIDFKDRLDRLEAVFNEVKTNARSVLSMASEIFVAQRAAQDIRSSSDPLMYQLTQLEDAYTQMNRLTISGQLPWIMAVGALIFLWQLLRVRFALERRKVALEEEKNRRTQQSILTLLDQMVDLADGDLTIQPAVDDQVTGAIADAVSYAVQEMRFLVSRIKQAAGEIISASSKSNTTAGRLSDKARQQVENITEASAKIQEIAHSMEVLSNSASKSSDVALQSVQVAKKGAESVQSTIAGMAQMRQQIQTTSKRIKRLGESSQQVGEIVALINDLSEHTNILSVNASIQATMAGEAGRGFSVVVDEVQQLAERSAQGARQITDILKHIQSDASAAVSSMEEATRGVVKSTELADQAGRSLGEIQSVSVRLSELIAEISRIAAQYAKHATRSSADMGRVSEVTVQTAGGAREVANLIGRLATLAQELEQSVSGFKLPSSNDQN